MGEYRDAAQDDTQDRVTIQEAAQRLGIKEDAVRKRIQRRSMRHEKTEDGRVYVWVDRAQDTAQDEQDTSRDEYRDEYRDAAQDDRLEDLREQVSYLRRQLEEEREARRRADVILGQLSQANAEQARTIRSIEAPGEPAGGRRDPAGDAEAPKEAEYPAESPHDIKTLGALSLVAPVGPVVAAAVFEASLWRGGAVPFELEIWLYLAAALALLPAVLGLAFGRTERRKVSAGRAQDEHYARELKDRLWPDPPKSVLDGFHPVNRSLATGALVAVMTAGLAGLIIASLHAIYSGSYYEGPTFSPTVFVVPLVAGVSACLLWIFSALLGFGWKQKRTQGAAAGQARKLDWKIVGAIAGNLVTAAATIISAVWVANITGG